MSVEDLLEVGARVIELAKAAGADEADLIASRTTDFEVKVADGEIVTLTQATAKGLGLRVFANKRLGFCTTSDFGSASLQRMAERAVAFANETADDPHNGLAEELEAGRIDAGTELDLYDPAVEALPVDTKIEWAHAMETAARAVDPRVCKFRESGVASSESDSVLISSNAAVRTMRSSGIAAWCNPIAEENGELQTEIWYDTRTHLEDLDTVESIGRIAGERAVRMLGARPIKTQNAAVIFEPHMAAGFVGGMLGALDGDMVYKKASFLADKKGEKIAPESISFLDDPHMPRGAGSAPFDAEGLPTNKKAILDHGTLTTFLYDSYTARKAGVKPTCNARRGYSGLPHAGPFNFYVAAGDVDPDEILSGVERGLLVTRGLGRGVNAVSGEYSRGANGLWIENGEVVHPVAEVTIAGDFLDLLGRIDAVGTDLQMRGSSGAPTLRIAEMTISGT